VHKTCHGGEIFPGRYSPGAVRIGLCIAVVLVAVAATGCGVESVKAYDVDATAKCLQDAGYRIQRANLGLVADSAPNGSIRAFEPGNAVTISFGNDHREATNISELYRKFAPKKLRPHIDDVMEVQKNAVILWTVTPPQKDHDKVFGCLKG
jgi:hypothetical protein